MPVFGNSVVTFTELQERHFTCGALLCDCVISNSPSCDLRIVKLPCLVDWLYLVDLS